MPVPNSQRREYLKGYFRDYNARPARAAYLRAKQREYRGTEPKADAAVLPVYRGDESGIRRCADWLLQRSGAGTGEKQA